MKEFPYFLKEISDFRHFQCDFNHSNLRCAGISIPAHLRCAGIPIPAHLRCAGIPIPAHPRCAGISIPAHLRCARYENATPPDFASLEQKYC